MYLLDDWDLLALFCGLGFDDFFGGGLKWKQKIKNFIKHVICISQCASLDDSVCLVSDLGSIHKRDLELQ